MPSEKTKKLLEGLGKITDSSPKPFQQEKYHSYTNRYYPNPIQKMPTRYDNSKKLKDAEGDEYIMIDRVYGGLYENRLLQADGSYYKGKLYKKRRLIINKDTITKEKTNFYSPCVVTADGRWFDNCGMPIEEPARLEPEKKKSAEDIEEEKRVKAEKEARILANLK